MYIYILAFLTINFINSCQKSCKTCKTRAYKINSCEGITTPYVSEVMGVAAIIDSVRSRGLLCNVDTVNELFVCDYEIDILESRGVKCK